jgi:ubiquinone/menaquinone biosynthesis C-methylase UbiE
VSSIEDDADEQRRANAERWEEAAAGWERHQPWMRRFAEPVAQWMVQAIRPQPGYQVLDLAAGIGETGFLAAELIAPGGLLISSDQAEAMVDAARRRAQELGLRNVEFKVLGGEWIDLPVASVDSVLCRFGYMLMTDPAAALAETRRVLRSGGRLALAVWASPEHNPWVTIGARLLLERGLMEAPVPGAPGMFAMADPARLAEMLEEAGFADVRTDTVGVIAAHDSLEAYFEHSLDINRAFHDAVMELAPEQVRALREELGAVLAPYTAADGSIAIPGCALVAAADA